MTTLVTPSTLSTAMSTALPYAIATYTQKTLVMGTPQLMTSLTLPRSGIITVSGAVGAAPSTVGNPTGALNGTLNIGGLLVSINLGASASATQSPTNKQACGATHYLCGLATGATGIVLGGPVHHGLLTVTAGQVLNLIALTIWQGTATNDFLTVGGDTGTDLSLQQAYLSYRYVA